MAKKPLEPHEAIKAAADHLSRTGEKLGQLADRFLQKTRPDIAITTAHEIENLLQMFLRAHDKLTAELDAQKSNANHLRTQITQLADRVQHQKERIDALTTTIKNDRKAPIP